MELVEVVALYEDIFDFVLVVFNNVHSHRIER